MNLRITRSLRMVMLHRALLLLFIPSMMAASPPRLTIERVNVAAGYIAEITPGADGTVIISGEYSATGLNQGEPRRPQIAVLDSTGKVVQRLHPPLTFLVA